MEVINPNNIKSIKQLEISQRVSMHLFSIVSKFYGAQEDIESIQLLEPSVKSCIIFLGESQAKINSAKNTAKNLPKYIAKTRGEFKGSEKWLSYLDFIHLYSEKLHEELSLLSVLLQDDSTTNAIKEKIFQSSLCKNNPNSGIHRTSMECSALLSKALDLHRDFYKN